MSVDVVAGLLLLVMFVVGTTTRANIGVLGLLASFLLGGLWLHEDVDDILSGFPASFFVLILGVTYLFSVANSNGTMDWIIGSAARFVRGRALAVPIGLFVAATVITAFGAPSQAAVAILAPIGIRLGRACTLPVFVTGIMVILGVCGGSFSPLNILAIVANQSLVRAGISPEPLALFAGAVAANAVTALAVLLVATVRRRRTARSERRAVPVGPGSLSGDGAGSGPADPIVDEATPTVGLRLGPPAVLTLAGFMVVMVGSMVFRLDLGALALAVALLLHLGFPRADAMTGVNWDVVLLICGLVTYIGVMQRAGTFDRMGGVLAGFGSPVVATLMICLGAAVVSAFASSTATIGTAVTLAVPLMAGGDLWITGVVTAICLSSTFVDASPFSSAGALVIAGAPADAGRQMFRRLLAWGLSMIIVAPVLTVLFFVALP
jgi:di/tricarboxylate transporter